MLIGLGIVIAAVVLAGLWALRSAPVCTCGEADCGGGCLTRRS